MSKKAVNYIGEVFGDYLIFAEKEGLVNREFYLQHMPSGEQFINQSYRLSQIKSGKGLPLPAKGSAGLLAAKVEEIQAITGQKLHSDHVVSLALKMMDLQIAEINSNRSNNSSRSLKDIAEESFEIPALPEVVYARAICIKGKRNCSVANTLYGFRKTISSELKSNTAGASMLSWSIASIIPNELSQTKLKAINESLSWKSKSRAAQREVYKELCSLGEFAEVLQPLHDYFGELREELSLEKSPLVVKLCEGLDLKAKDLLDVVNSTGKSLTEAAIVALTGQFRNSGVEPALIPSELVRLRPEWKTKVNSLESEVKLAHQQYLQKMKE